MPASQGRSPNRSACDHARAEGRYVGIGVANYVEGTGRGPFESAVVRIKPSGKIVVYTGATDQGQGLKTTLAQVCAAQTGAAIEDIEVVTGDTGSVSLGLGAFASRQAVTAGYFGGYSAKMQDVGKKELQRLRSSLDQQLIQLIKALIY